MLGLFSIQKNAGTEFEKQSIAAHTLTLQSGMGVGGCLVMPKLVWCNMWMAPYFTTAATDSLYFS